MRKTTKKVCVTIAMIERADPCMPQYAQFLSRVRGPHPSKAYVERQKAWARVRRGGTEGIDSFAARMRKRRVFRVGRHDKIEVERIRRMHRSWAEWIATNVLRGAAYEQWRAESEPSYVPDDAAYDEDEYAAYDYSAFGDEYDYYL